MIEMCSVDGIVYFLRFQSKIVYLLFITCKVIECVIWADSPKNTRIWGFSTFGLVLPAFGANVSALKSLG